MQQTSAEMTLVKTKISSVLITASSYKSSGMADTRIWRSRQLENKYKDSVIDTGANPNDFSDV